MLRTTLKALQRPYAHSHLEQLSSLVMSSTASYHLSNKKAVELSAKRTLMCCCVTVRVCFFCGLQGSGLRVRGATVQRKWSIGTGTWRSTEAPMAPSAWGQLTHSDTSLSLLTDRVWTCWGLLVMGDSSSSVNTSERDAVWHHDSEKWSPNQKRGWKLWPTLWFRSRLSCNRDNWNPKSTFLCTSPHSKWRSDFIEPGWHLFH